MVRTFVVLCNCRTVFDKIVHVGCRLNGRPGSMEIGEVGHTGSSICAELCSLPIPTLIRP